MNIPWLRLASAMMYYQDIGYRQKEVPWMVPLDVSMITCPQEHWVFSFADGAGLLGSAEQGFLDQEIKGLLGKGRFVSLTPCFRNEDVVDDLHKKHFMKVELYQNVNVGEAALMRMLDDAKKFFLSQGGDVKIVDTVQGYDLEINGVEVGSYGVREHEGVEWVYGTGLAEPRFSQALKASRN